MCEPWPLLPGAAPCCRLLLQVLAVPTESDLFAEFWAPYGWFVVGCPFAERTFAFATAVWAHPRTALSGLAA